MKWTKMEVVVSLRLGTLSILLLNGISIMYILRFRLVVVQTLDSTKTILNYINKTITITNLQPQTTNDVFNHNGISLNRNGIDFQIRMLSSCVSFI